MKTKHVKNTEQMNKKGQIEKLPWWGKGGKRGKLPGGQRGPKIAQGGALPLLSHSCSSSLAQHQGYTTRVHFTGTLHIIFIIFCRGHGGTLIAETHLKS